ncbi:MAG: hypothetical protein ACLT98_13125, partial [Eggerthellaceae bacterium]
MTFNATTLLPRPTLGGYWDDRQPSLHAGRLIEIMNYGDDYKTTSVADANWFSWGVKVSAYGKTAFLAGDIGNYDGDEDRLAVRLGHVDVLKMGHHGLSTSSTPEYLSALAPDYAMWTSDYA